ncbi:hypothetical protein NL676_000442 [Syzygium grande]|nr:hypothetical protein NL676_000442 [Syzygium grande]
MEMARTEVNEQQERAGGEENRDHQQTRLPRTTHVPKSHRHQFFGCAACTSPRHRASDPSSSPPFTLFSGVLDILRCVFQKSTPTHDSPPSVESLGQITPLSSARRAFTPLQGLHVRSTRL